MPHSILYYYFKSFFRVMKEMGFQYDQDVLKEVMKAFSLGKIASMNEIMPIKDQRRYKYNVNPEKVNKLISLSGCIIISTSFLLRLIISH